MTKRRRKPLAERYWPKVDRRGEDECWPWTGAKLHNGYGIMQTWNGPNRGVLYAHRLAYEFAYRPLASGMYAMHTCDNPWCCNPAHIREGSPYDNLDDCRSKGRWRRSQVRRKDLEPREQEAAALLRRWTPITKNRLISDDGEVPFDGKQWTARLFGSQAVTHHRTMHDACRAVEQQPA